MSTTDATSARRIELILQQVESLPTLPQVAMRLLQITSADDSDAQQVIDLVKNDAPLTAKILQMCRSAAVAVRTPIVTVDRAVVMLGFDAIRNAVLSVKVFETFSQTASTEGGAEDESAPAPAPDRSAIFQRPAFWQHCFGVAVAAELIAARHSELDDLNPGEAFVCGLLHDIGKLALEHVLPKAYQRVVELTEQTHTNIAEVERKVLGLDHHTAGKRLAEHWGLGQVVQDAIWLHGSTPRSLPDLPHRRLVALVHLADLIVRRQHIGYSGNHRISDDAADRAEAIGLDSERVHAVVGELHEQIESRSEALGLNRSTDRKLFLDSIMQANQLLGRLNQQLDGQRRVARTQNRAIQSIVEFHHQAHGPGQSVGDVLSSVVVSAASVMGEGHFGIIYQPSGQSAWQVSQYNAEGRVVRSQLTDPPAGVTELSALASRDELPVGWMSVLPWLSDYLAGFDDIRRIRLLPLPCAWGTAAVLVHDHEQLPPAPQMEALTRTWGAAIGAATQHEGARRLGEQLAEANRVLTETQEQLLLNESMAKLGEMAAGAAHEMNNPLAVISGRAQLLSSKLESGSKPQADAALIYQQAQKLSDLVTALHTFAQPPRPKVRSIAVLDIIERATRRAHQRQPDRPAVRFSPGQSLPSIRTDPDQLAEILAELIVNAHEAEPANSVQVIAQIDPFDDRLILRVTDDGAGMDAHTLEHAFDPFFSSKRAGRQPGLGLARARRLAEGLDGTIRLESTPGRGTTATVALPLAGPQEARNDADADAPPPPTETRPAETASA